jgi:hypothetical protein
MNQKKWAEQPNEQPRDHRVSPVNQNIVNALDEWHANRYDKTKNNTFMVGISRDGETPHRSLYRFSSALDAVNAYNEYQDWGFAKKFLTVTLYMTNGTIEEKVLHAPKAGECVFERHQYYIAARILSEAKDSMPEADYNDLVRKFALLFSHDSYRFDPERFFVNCKSSLTEAVE